ncbi:NB-ARC domains-containing protein [Tanacetum coccineum]
MKLRYCYNLTTTPDFSEITNLEELNLEGCVNMVTVHPSIGMLKRLVVLNMRDCRQARSFPSKVEMDSLRVLNLSGCLKVNKLSEDLGRIKSLTELQVDRTAITELPSFLINLHFYCNLEQVPESIGGLSCLERLGLEGNNFTILPVSLSQVSHLRHLWVDGCKKLEVLPELPPSLEMMKASNCTSLREVSGSSKDAFRRIFNDFRNCPNLFKNVTIDNDGSISKTQCLDSSVTHQLSAFLEYVGLQTKLFGLPANGYLEIVYHGNSMPGWFTNRSMGNHVKVELPSDWSYDTNFRGYAACVVFKCKKPFNIYAGISLKNFDGASITKGYFPFVFKEFLKREVVGTQDSYMIWLSYTKDTREWKEAKNFVTFSVFEEDNEDVEVKECGVRLICDEDIQQEADLSMFQSLPTPTQHGGMLGLYYGESGYFSWSW